MFAFVLFHVRGMVRLEGWMLNSFFIDLTGGPPEAAKLFRLAAALNYEPWSL